MLALLALVASLSAGALAGTATVAAAAGTPNDVATAASTTGADRAGATTQVVTGGAATCLVRAGTLRCWGFNVGGSLGRGDTAARGDGPDEMGDDLAPIDLGTGRTVRQVSIGSRHVCAILDDGTVRCWGSNALAQLGLGDLADRGDDPGEMGDALPTIDLGTGRTARQISAGTGLTCALLDNGTVTCWGTNLSGELGQGDTTTRGDNSNELGDALPAIDLGTGRTARQVSAGGAFACALLDNGTVKCWGTNTAGQLGQGDTANRGDDPNELGDTLPAIDLGGLHATSISAGVDSACAVLSDRTAKCWGENTAGQLGQGDTASRGDAPSEMGSALPAVDLGGTNVLGVGVGLQRACALLAGGAVKCWGRNGDGQLGLGDTNARGDEPSEMGSALPAVDLGTGAHAVTLSVGQWTTCVQLAGGPLKCWGGESDGVVLGYGDTANRGDAAGEMGDSLPALDVGFGLAPVEIATGQAHSCARFENGSVKCWGDGTWGQLGLGSPTKRGDGANEMGDSLPAVNLGTGRTAVHMAARYNHTCAILEDGALKCWGDNASGQLGLGDTNARGDGANEMGDNLPAIDLGTGRTAVDVALGSNFTCALLDDGAVRCWGANGQGQLGQGDTAARGDNSTEMGDNLPAIDLGTGRTAQQIAVGLTHVCALLDDGTEKCWGANGQGQLGQGDTTARGDNSTEMGDNLPAIDLGTGRTAQQIAVGLNHSCAILDEGSTKCWGNNNFGQLGLGDTDARGDGASEMGANLPVIDLGTGRRATQLVGNYRSTCALLDDGTLKCWGYNVNGQLGLGDVNARGDGAGEMGANLAVVDLGAGRRATRLSSGYAHACALLDDGTLRCWGSNDSGQLGRGDTNARGDGANEMGADLAATVLLEPPTATWIAPGASSSSRTVSYGLVFSELISTLTPASFRNLGTAGGCTFHPDSSSAVSIAVDVTCATDGTLILRLKSDSVVDAAGTPGPVTARDAVTVTIVDAPPGSAWTPPASPTTDTTLAYTLSFNEPISGLAAGDLTIGGTAPGCSATVPASSGTTFTVTVTCGGEGIVLVTLLADSVTDSASLTGPTTDSPAGAVTIGEAATINALTPARLLDTRTGLGGVAKHPIGSTTMPLTPITFHVAGTNGVPASGAAAVSMNLTVVEPTTDGYATVYPCGTPPNTSNVNFRAGATTANAVIAPLSAGGDFCVAVFGRADVIADVNGWYGAGSGFDALSPARLLDTRTGLGGVPKGRFGSTSLPLTAISFHAAGASGVPASGAAAVSLNVTVVEPTTDGYATVYPCGAVPPTSNVNFRAGATTANAVIAPLSSGGDFCIAVFGNAHVIADVNGWYATGSGFAALNPVRMLDTRTGLGGVPKARIGQTHGTLVPLTFHVAGTNGVPVSGAAAVSLNVTVVEPTTGGYATVYPCGTLPNTSNVNFNATETTANAVIAPLSAGGDICIVVFGNAHVIADVNGWYAG